MTRRVVTGHNAEGKSVILSDSDHPTVKYEHTPGFESSLIWRTDAPPAEREEMTAEPLATFVPAPGETIALTVTFPPDSVFVSGEFDGLSAVQENLHNLPGLADLFEPDAPGMHTTPTVDYVVVLDGSLVLEIDDGVTTHTLHAGDILVQQSTRHAWRVPGDKPATIFVVLMGAAA
ncbi:cupin domain-containing protein [Herbiconiux daphne]|uniref:Cupin domain-containing protein n=1 Tax=Herbiconiux daphne TaxID=2970914 RepID=A0ABT2H735_9MICO|nr:cupin domain-containing protein [Herbiconiux daphne]MCS5735737.1 cupin domain-containing protein [Herbiconiux daphne]